MVEFNFFGGGSRGSNFDLRAGLYSEAAAATLLTAEQQANTESTNELFLARPGLG